MIKQLPDNERIASTIFNADAEDMQVLKRRSIYTSQRNTIGRQDESMRDESSVKNQTFTRLVSRFAISSKFFSFPPLFALTFHFQRPRLWMGL